MSERSAADPPRPSPAAGRPFSPEPWEARIGDGQTVPLGGRWAREMRRCELRRSTDPVHHAITTRPDGFDLLVVLGLVILAVLASLLGWMVAT